MSDRIEQLLAQLIESQAKTQQQVDSNARAIAALAQQSSEGITNTLHAINEQNQIISESRERLDRTERIQENNSVQLAELTTAVAETNQRIQILIEESRDTRNWLRAAQENIQTLFSEIRAIWDRLNVA